MTTSEKDYTKSEAKSNGQSPGPTVGANGDGDVLVKVSAADLKAARRASRDKPQTAPESSGTETPPVPVEVRLKALAHRFGAVLVPSGAYYEAKCPLCGKRLYINTGSQWIDLNVFCTGPTGQCSTAKILKALGLTLKALKPSWCPEPPPEPDPAPEEPSVPRSARQEGPATAAADDSPPDGTTDDAVDAALDAANTALEAAEAADEASPHCEKPHSGEGGGEPPCDKPQNREGGGGGALLTARLTARKVFSKYLFLKDPDVVDVILAVPAGNRLPPSDPLWLFLKGAPGSGKTELLTSLFPLEDWAHFTSNLTSKTLISGYVDSTGNDHSLLPKLNGKTLVIKDFTTILDKNDTERDEIFAQLRDCYDGYAARDMGTGRKVFESRFNLLAGVTKEIERAWHLSQLGERFLCWTMDTDRKKQAQRALGNRDKLKEMRKALAKAAKDVLESLPKVIPQVSEDMEKQTLTLADLLARLRTYVSRDRNDVVHDSPEIEVPTRIVKQLSRLGQSVALVRGKTEVSEEEFAIMRKVALSSVPTTRLRVFQTLMYTKGGTDDPKKVGMACGISESVARRHLEDLVLVELADRKEVADRRVRYSLKGEVLNECVEVGVF